MVYYNSIFYYNYLGALLYCLLGFCKRYADVFFRRMSLIALFSNRDVINSTVDRLWCVYNNILS